MKSLGRIRKIQLPLWASFLCAVLLAGGITLVSLWCQPNALRTIVTILWNKPLLIFLNCLPMGLLLLVFAFLFGNVFYGAAAANLIMGLLSVVNRVKIEVRDEPLFPRDFALLKEVGSIVSTYKIRYPWSVVVVVVLVSALLCVMGLWVKSKPSPFARLQGWKARAAGTAASALLLVLATLTVLSSSDLNRSIGCSNPYRLSVVFNETGFPYSFFHQFTTYTIDRPESFNKAEAEQWDSAPANAGNGAPVSVIMVMDEAFSDITDDKAFTYTEENDPLPNLHALRKDPHAVTGHIVVPVFAGGTANTEFDVLTGMQTASLSSGNTSAMRVINRNLDSLFRVFNADGYHTSYFHPGDDWFYNRENVYRWLGAQETRFIDEMRGIEYKGSTWWVTDNYMASQIEAEFEAAVESGQPLFHFTTTIQNHMSYTAAKYGEDFICPTVPTAQPVSDEVQTMLSVYAEGVRDADAMLGRLRDYFAAREEPVVLVFFGDHLPYLGDNRLGYTELGMEVAKPDAEQENPLCPYETPYVIWANDAAAEQLDWEKTVSELGLPENGTISASFLGAAVLEVTGRGQDTPWFGFLNELRRQTPAVHQNTYMLPEGTYTTGDALFAQSPQMLETIDQWRCWSYYKLKYKDVN